MANRIKPQSPTEFAALVPSQHREHTVEKTERAERGRREHGEKKKVARRIDSMRAKAPAVSDGALREHDNKNAEADLKKPRPSRRQRRAAAFAQRGKRLRRRMEDHLAKHTAKLKSLGQHDANPVGVPPEVWRTNEMILADGTAHTARMFLSGLPRTVARRIMNGALKPKPYKGKRKREGVTLREPRCEVLDGSRRHWESPGHRRWNHPAAIRTIAVGVAIYKLSVRTRRKGYSKVCRGIPRAMLAALAQDPDTGVRPSINTLFGNHRGTPGDVRALEAAGLFQIDQPPGAKVAARDKGPSGFAFNVYWFGPSTVITGDGELSEQYAEIERLSAASLRAELGLEGPDPPTRPTDAGAAQPA